MTVQPEADSPRAEIDADQRPTPNQKNRGALPKDHGLHENGENGNKKFLMGTSVLLDLPANE